MFGLYEALEEAHYRVRSLARTARNGNLGITSRNWLAQEGYYLRSTAYKLILPVVIFRLMQRRLTFVDVNLDKRIGLLYLLMKLYSRSFTDDFDFARVVPKLPYDPNNDNWRNLAKGEPAVYVRQALLVGDLENIADSLLCKDDQEPLRPMFFGEFDRLLENTWKDDESIWELTSLIKNFSPEVRPVLRRLLITQACFGQLILATYDGDFSTKKLREQLQEIVSSPEIRRELAWAAGTEPAEDLQVASEYLNERLGWLKINSSSLEIRS